jgi:hypothetical protein
MIKSDGCNTETKKIRSKYDRTIRNDAGECIVVDVYDVLGAFNVTNSALQHLIKKALCVGLRGHKTVEQDLADIEASALRATSINKQYPDIPF